MNAESAELRRSAAALLRDGFPGIAAVMERRADRLDDEEQATHQRRKVRHSRKDRRTK